MRMRVDLGVWAVRLLAVAGTAGCSQGITVHNDVGGSTNGGGGGAAGGGGASGGIVGTGGTQTPIVVDGSNHFPCENSKPRDGQATGVEICDNGMIHRVSTAACGTETLADEPRMPLGAGGGCSQSSQCAQEPPSVCSPDALCGAACRTDEDCTGPSSICLCSGPYQGVCVAATCGTDQDCGEGFYCVLSNPQCPTRAPSFACQTPEDSCAPLQACAGGNACFTGGVGAMNPAAFECTFCGTGGRPFLVASETRVAATHSSAAWLERAVDVRFAFASEPLLAYLAEHFRQLAELEHASIAAFARFTLELLSLAAPPVLVEQATRAMADETAHARTCYALASRCAGRALGPAGLDVSGALSHMDVVDIVERAVLEGCIGETLAAIEVQEAASHAAEPAMQRLLARISEDEARHAELSWQFLRWLLEHHPQRQLLAERVRVTIEQARAGIHAAKTRAAELAPGISERELLAAGVLAPIRQAELRSQAFEAVVLPCADTLLQCFERHSAAASALCS